jgi:hypothetical protein
MAALQPVIGQQLAHGLGPGVHSRAKRKGDLLSVILKNNAGAGRACSRLCTLANLEITGIPFAIKIRCGDDVTNAPAEGNPQPREAAEIRQERRRVYGLFENVVLIPS